MALTTHILDIAHGRPAASVQVQLFSIDEAGTRTQLREDWTNDDGRLNVPMLHADQLKAGEYEMLFFIGNYFASIEQAPADEPRFLQHVCIRFGISAPEEHYHIPLLISPWGYQTYRGS
ncbi:5-hydroxyisourate hydrolase [Sinobaca qinghaiensis]|uniref:5-hydroxyisourate hydrolase n=2 Tax=Sinobaca qinghaiensis TaxID=342944 RepID=A0A419UZW9_9BACL|nr:5-hydroxyisourate hydrolase [Sinobaca qinghaiensis]